MIRCPKCWNVWNEILEVWKIEKDLVKYKKVRKRKCNNCSLEFYTDEVILSSEISIEKLDWSSYWYERDEIVSSIRKSFEWINVSLNQIENIVDEIEIYVLSDFKSIRQDELEDMIIESIKKISNEAAEKYVSSIS